MSEVKGIILAGGTGSRLSPATSGVSKQMLPIYDKPMIYYPLSVLMLAGIKDIMIITRPEELGLFERLLGDGSQWGISICYRGQPKPEGLAQAFLIAADFIRGHRSALVLGDNLFFGHGLQDILAEAVALETGASVFTYVTTEPERYGVLYTDKDGVPTEIVEKPVAPKSNLAVVGLYFFDQRAAEIAASLKPSARGELEIVDMINRYIGWRQCQVLQFGRGYAWFDSGTPESLLQASNFVYTLETRQGMKIACLEEIAYRRGFIDGAALKSTAEAFAKCPYGDYLRSLVSHELLEG